MTFGQIMTVAAVAAGPLGIVMGWTLSNLTEGARAKRVRLEARADAQQARVIDYLRAVDSTEAHCRSMAHGLILRATGTRVSDESMIAMQDKLNGAMEQGDPRLLEMEVLGPDEMLEPGRLVQVALHDLIAATQSLNQDVTAEKSRRFQEDVLPAAVDAIAESKRLARAILQP